MSAYREIKTNLTDSDCLKKALEEKGFHPEVHDTPQQLVGYQNDKRKDTAEIILRKKEVGAASNDIGFKKQSDGTYQAVISSYDSSKYNDAWLKDLTTKYNVLKTKKTMAREGYEVSGQNTDAQGTITYKFRKINA